jgi:alanyl-tRNA synthetase
MTQVQIRKAFFDFFEKKGHKKISSSPLLPTDPSVLFTTAGMQQFKPYYTGEADAMKDFNSLNTVSIQKCVRTSDIDEVGDASHLTFFEMMGNFSFGGYFKKEAIALAHEFITREMNLEIDFVSVFEPAAGEEKTPADIESEKIWQEIDPAILVKKSGRADNFWGPTGDEGPCGPTTEIYVNGVEVWNIVFNQYYQHKDGRLEPLKISGIDTGMGLERLAMMAQEKENVFETDLLSPIMLSLPLDLELRKKRIVADHARTAVFLIADGVKPSNKEQGYVLRKLLRRAMVYLVSPVNNWTLVPFQKVIENYSDFYPNLKSGEILQTITEEEKKFSKTLSSGLKELDKYEEIDAPTAFKLYESYGLPFEIIKEVGGSKTKNLTREKFDEEFKKHQELSRTASAGMFKGGLADASAETVRLHTAAHLMLEAMRRVLGDHVRQKGSNITPERLRFDFSHGEKIAPEQIKKIEAIVNAQIEKKLPVHFEEMTLEKAKEIGATGVFESKYGDKVKVYFIGHDGDYFSKEICGGPHVGNTAEIGNFKIIKEESASAGVRRIKAVVEKIG